jgi:hypothetical protein
MGKNNSHNANELTSSDPLGVFAVIWGNSNQRFHKMVAPILVTYI